MGAADAPSAQAQENVRRELWLSFVSMVRAYAGARNASGAGPRLTVAVDQPDALSVYRPGAVLEIEFQPHSGQGRWREMAGEPAASTEVRSGPVRLELDGVSFDGEPRMEFDLAAIELLAAFDRPEANERNEQKR